MTENLKFISKYALNVHLRFLFESLYVCMIFMKYGMKSHTKNLSSDNLALKPCAFLML